MMRCDNDDWALSKSRKLRNPNHAYYYRALVLHLT
jgi:hypothetical protein